MSGWSSPFKDFNSIVGAVSKTIKDAEKAIDKSLGIEEEKNDEHKQSTNEPETTENTSANTQRRVVTNVAPVSTKKVTNSVVKQDIDLESFLNTPSPITSPTRPVTNKLSTPKTIITNTNANSNTIPEEKIQDIQDNNKEVETSQNEKGKEAKSDTVTETASAESNSMKETNSESISSNDSSTTNPTIEISNEDSNSSNVIESTSNESSVESTVPSIKEDNNNNKDDSDNNNNSTDKEVGINAPSTPTTATPNPVVEYSKYALLEQIVKDRERQLQVILTDNASLRDENEKLKSQLKEYQEMQANSNMESLKIEFSKRLGDLERKLAAIKKERDDLKKTLETSTSSVNSSNSIGSSVGELSNSSSSSSSTLAEKEKQVSELRMEGEKLAKRIMSLEAHSKTLKATKIENEKTIASLKERLLNTENLLESKVLKIKELEEESRKYSDTYNTMKDLSESTVRQLEEKSRGFENVHSKAEEYKLALEKAWIEIADLKKSNASQLVKTSNLLKESEAKIREEYQVLLSKQNKEFLERETTLSNTIQELRNTISSIQDQNGWKEEKYIQEIFHLKAKVQMSESRNEELFSSVPETTRPLLRQIETLQSTMNERAKIWEELEKQYNARIMEAEERSISSLDKEKQMSEALSEIILKVKTLESEIINYRNTITRLNAELDFTRTLVNEKQSQIDNFNSQNTSLQLQYEHDKQLFVKQEAKLKSEIIEFQVKWDILYKEKSELQDKWNKITEDNKMSISNSISSTSANNSPPLVKSSSQNRLDLISSLSSSSIGNSVVNAPITSLPLEKLQSLLKQKEGEIIALQEQISSLQKTRDILQDELVNLTSKNEELFAEVTELKEVRNQMKEVSGRYNTALELIGEKEEQVEELRADIVDMKMLYKEQINELLEKVERLSSKN